METSKLTVLLDTYSSRILNLTKEFEEITKNPATRNDFELQYKWSILFNVLKDLTSEYKGVLTAMNSLEIPVSDEDRVLLEFDMAKKHGASFTEDNKLAYDEAQMRQVISAHTQGFGMAQPGNPNGKIIL